MRKEAPVVELKILTSILEQSGKIEGFVKEGDTTMYVLKGTAPLYKRTNVVRKIDKNHVDLMCATGHCINMKGDCLNLLMKHLETEHRWKDGAYFV